MAYHHADTTVILSIACLGIEEGSLQDTGGEYDLVGQRTVVCVDGLRSHAPFGLVDGFAPFLQITVLCPHRRVVHVLVIGEGRVYLKQRVVLPLVGITDLDGEGV